MNLHAQILLLPRNYESTDEYYLYDNTVYTINKVLNQAGINSTYLDDKPIPRYTPVNESPLFK